jgi:uncharacterized protein YdhG (YjbR/CyaY superfamily)
VADPGSSGGSSRRVAEYLAALPPEPRAALEELRRTIMAAAPDAEETIAYGMPAFRQDGRFLVSYAAYKDHCSMVPATDSMKETLGDRLEPYVSGKGTLRFRPDSPMPTSLVRRIVRIRLEEVARATRR